MDKEALREQYHDHVDIDEVIRQFHEDERQSDQYEPSDYLNGKARRRLRRKQNRRTKK